MYLFYILFEGEIGKMNNLFDYLLSSLFHLMLHPLLSFVTEHHESTITYSHPQAISEPLTLLSHCPLDGRHPFSKACLQHAHTVIQPGMGYSHTLSRGRMGFLPRGHDARGRRKPILPRDRCENNILI